MSWTRSLLEGLAGLLDDADVVTWRASGGYTAGDVRPLFMGTAPATPDTVAALSAYGGSDDFALADVTQPVQFYLRGSKDIRVLNDFGDAIFDALHGLRDLTVGGVAVTSIKRSSWVPLGPDDSGRWQATHNYYLHAMRPTSARTD